MNHDCIYFDECDDKHLSSCCGDELIHHDICSGCKDHSGDGCDDCDKYMTDQDLKEAEGERKYQADKEERAFK